MLHRLSFSETDRIVTLYTRERGKLSAIAKGARKPISRLAGATEVLTCGKFHLAEGKNLDIIAQVEVKESFPRIHADLNRIAYGSYLAELVDKSLVRRGPGHLWLVLPGGASEEPGPQARGASPGAAGSGSRGFVRALPYVRGEPRRSRGPA